MELEFEVRVKTSFNSGSKRKITGKGSRGQKKVLKYHLLLENFYNHLTRPSPFSGPLLRHLILCRYIHVLFSTFSSPILTIFSNKKLSQKRGYLPNPRGKKMDAESLIFLVHFYSVWRCQSRVYDIGRLDFKAEVYPKCLVK